MKFGELSYFSNFFDFGNVFGDIHPFGLGPEVKGKLEEIRSLLETLGGTLYPRNFFYLYKTWYGQQLLLVKKFCATHPTRVSLSKI